MEPQAPPDNQARAEQLLRDAHIQRMRKQWGAAETLCREALELAPDDAMGQEMLGDLLLDKGNLDEALELYRKAFEQHPEKSTLEAKVARAALLKDHEQQERIAAELLLNSPKKKSERKRNATIAALLSLLCPGLGQLFIGQYVKGGILMGVGLFSLFFGVPELLKFFATIVAGASAASSRHHAAVPEANGMLAVIGLLGILVWLYSLLDASAQAGKSAYRGGDV